MSRLCSAARLRSTSSPRSPTPQFSTLSRRSCIRIQLSIEYEEGSTVPQFSTLSRRSCVKTR